MGVGSDPRLSLLSAVDADLGWDDSGTWVRPRRWRAGGRRCRAAGPPSTGSPHPRPEAGCRGRPAMPIVRMPPRRPASTPMAASSTTMQRAGGTWTFSAARRKTSGAGLPCATSSAETVAWNTSVEVQHVDEDVDVGGRRRRGDRLTPAGRVEPGQPVADAGQQRDAVAPDQLAVALFLEVADALHVGGADAGKVAREDAVVARAEPAVEIGPGQLHAQLGQRLMPGEPVDTRPSR